MSTTINEATPQTETLSREDQMKLIAEAIKKRCPNLDSWGNDSLFFLLDYNEKNGASITTYNRFLIDLLLILARPEVSQMFHKEIGNTGLEFIRKLAVFFEDLQWQNSYDEWLDYKRTAYFNSAEKNEILFWAKKYLSDEDRLRVEAAHEHPYKAKLEALEKSMKLEEEAAAAKQAGVVSDPGSGANVEAAPASADDHPKSWKPVEKRTARFLAPKKKKPARRK